MREKRRSMKVPDVLQEVAESEPGEWQLVEVPHEEKEVLRYSFNTEFRIEHHKPWAENREYRADWAEDFLGESELDTSYYVYHGSTPIKELSVAIVDNKSVLLPISNIHNGYVSQLDYKIAQILSSDNTRLNKVLDQADLEISDQAV